MHLSVIRCLAISVPLVSAPTTFQLSSLTHITLHHHALPTPFQVHLSLLSMLFASTPRESYSISFLTAFRLLWGSLHILLHILVLSTVMAFFEGLIYVCSMRAGLPLLSVSTPYRVKLLCSAFPNGVRALCATLKHFFFNLLFVSHISSQSVYNVTWTCN